MSLLVDSAQVVPALQGVVVVVLFDYLSQHRAWAWMNLIQGPAVFKKIPGVLFAKVMGSGHAGGFSLRPSPTHQGLIFLFDTTENAKAFLSGAELKPYVQKARECWRAILGITSVRGQWDALSFQSDPSLSLASHAGVDAFSQEAITKLGPDPHTQPIAAITRASIRPTKAVAFWRYAPAAQKDLDRCVGCDLAVGLGEAPLLRQCTFSVWQNTQAMQEYAHSGAHKQAIAAAYKQDYFSESMFMRMRVLFMQGVWNGREYASL